MNKQNKQFFRKTIAIFLNREMKFMYGLKDECAQYNKFGDCFTVELFILKTTMLILSQ